MTARIQALVRSFALAATTDENLRVALVAILNSAVNDIEKLSYDSLIDAPEIPPANQFPAIAVNGTPIAAANAVTLVNFETS